ncbi:hypothetical protein [Pseudoalteromonas translucida]|uniref:Orphan protein putative membrane protein, putative fimbrial assembly protein n=1 Tax=Pseudoalteromonas translucida (strain TAC 125) TaxID=326442 RepID=Q3IIC8_PSET1|nr:hypothetical protein [Pseudoalteromonas translucida]CAI85480.1 putative orphan protein; putative membrane protein, putative fimbrial assembly protein [Pseudoalteromonas translucida]
MLKQKFKQKLQWSIIHLLTGALVLTIAAMLIYLNWFYDGRYLLTDLVGLAVIIFTLDLILGPVLSFWLLSPNKTKKENVINILLIVLLQVVSFSYGVVQIDSQRLAYIIKWQSSYFAVSKSESRRDEITEHFYNFNEPKVGTVNRSQYDKLIKESISPVEMYEFFEEVSFATECGLQCAVITKKGIVNVTKNSNSLVFNKSLR